MIGLGSLKIAVLSFAVLAAGFLLCVFVNPFAALIIGILACVLLGAGLLSAVLIVLLKPLLVRYALARPNARSSHKVPTPQGGGIAVIGAVLLATSGTVAMLDLPSSLFQTFVVLSAALTILAVVGAIDDIRPLPAGPRLVLQIIAVAAVVLTCEVRILPNWVPLGLEQAIQIVGGVWFVNLVNFMDGLDWITVAEMVPITAFMVFAILCALNETPPPVVAVAFGAAALCGALLGFAPFNKPVAKLFLGDVGSLPIGLVVGWMLLEFAGTGALAAAILLPLYYLMDATITLLNRLARGERVWEAHRSHYYQQATTNGFTALAVSAHVFGLNLALAALAAVTLIWPSPAISLAAILVGIGLVSMMLRHFAQPRPEGSR